MKKLFKQLRVLIKPIKKGDNFFGYTSQLAKNKDMRKLHRVIGISVSEEQGDEFTVNFRYNGTDGSMVFGTRKISRELINSHYINDRMFFT